VVAAAAWMLGGGHGALSALLGGCVNISACVVFAVLIATGRSNTAAGTVRTMLRAEAGKITVIILQLWFVMTHYRDNVPAAFIAAFVIAVLVSQAAVLAPNRKS
jgi:ATP synthase protein I